VVHAALFSVWAVLLSYQATHTAPTKLTWIEVSPLSDLEKLKQKQREEAEKNSQRIVQTAPENPSKEAAPDSYLGERTQSVDRQTVNKNRVTAQGKAKSLPKNPTQAEEEKRVSFPNSLQPFSQSGPLSKLGIPLPPAGDLVKRDQERFRRDVETESGVPQDYIQGLKESETTALNTKEYMFYGYFQRIRKRLDLAWTGSLRTQLQKLYKAGRQLATDMDHTTRIMVTLNKAGEVVRVQVLEESGTHDLDDAAIRAFNQAGPFPNPPKGIINAKGEIQIRWDFVLKT